MLKRLSGTWKFCFSWTGRQKVKQNVVGMGRVFSEYVDFFFFFNQTVAVGNDLCGSKKGTNDPCNSTHHLELPSVSLG